MALSKRIAELNAENIALKSKLATYESLIDGTIDNIHDAEDNFDAIDWQLIKRKYVEKDDEYIIALINENKINITDDYDECGDTIWSLSCQYGRINVIKTCSNLGIDITNIKNKNGMDVLDIATNYNQNEILEYYQTNIINKIWLNSCLSYNHSIARLIDLYPSLIKQFKRLTKCDQFKPTLQEMRFFFVENGGVYDTASNDIYKFNVIMQGLWRSMSDKQEYESIPMDIVSICNKYFYELINESYESQIPYICYDKFVNYFAWFRSMCDIITDLHNPLLICCLFWSGTISFRVLQYCAVGTFILRLGTTKNTLVLTYTYYNPDLSTNNILLTRVGNNKYKFGPMDRAILLSDGIKALSVLKYLFTPNHIFEKKFLF